MAEPNPMQALAAAEHFYGRLVPRRATWRLVFGLVIGAVAALLSHRHVWEFRLLLGWDAGAFALLAFIRFTAQVEAQQTACFVLLSSALCWPRRHKFRRRGYHDVGGRLGGGGCRGRSRSRRSLAQGEGSSSGNESQRAGQQ